MKNTTLAICFSVADYAAHVWCRSTHTQIHTDTENRINPKKGNSFDTILKTT